MMVRCENGHGQGGYEYYFILFDESTGNVGKQKEAEKDVKRGGRVLCTPTY